MNTFFSFGNIVTIYILFINLGYIKNTYVENIKLNSLNNYLCWLAIITQFNSIHFNLILPIWNYIFK
jgi:hypothetical protein